MNPKHRTDIVLTNQKGIAAIMVALVITVLLGMAALAIDIGYRNVAQNEIQNIADAAALAGAGELSGPRPMSGRLLRAVPGRLRPV